MLGKAYQTNCVVTMNMLRNTLELGEPRNWMGIHCELDGNTFETKRMQKILTPHPPPFSPKEKNWVYYVYAMTFHWLNKISILNFVHHIFRPS